MKKHHNLKSDAPRLVVAVPSITPIYALWSSETNELKRVYGGNICENSVYTEGTMPKLFRMAAEDESYQNELIFAPLPANIEEVVLSESPECQLVITSFKTLELPEQEQPPGCVMLRHPEADNGLERMNELYAEKKKKEYEKKASKNKDPKHRYLPLFDEPLNQTG